MTRPAEGAHDSGGPRRFLIAAAVARYAKCADWDRPGLVQAREQIIEIFTRLDYRHDTALGLDPTRQQVTDQLRAFCRSDERREDDLVVVYLSGHGEVLDDVHRHVLLMADTDPADLEYTSLPTADLVRVFSGTRVRRLLLILDTCYSGHGGNELAAAALERVGAQWGRSTNSPGLVIVSSAQPHQQAKAGLFPHLLSQAIKSRATAGHAPAHLSVSAVVQQMNDHDDKPGYQHISLSLLGLTGEPPDFLTNPRHNVRLTDVDLALQDAAEFDAHALQRDTEFTTHLLVRAMGYHGDAAHGWWFCGRHHALTELAAWLNQDDTPGRDLLPGEARTNQYVRVVTAGPGSGKTAVLGLLATLTMPERRRTVPIDALGLEPEWTPREDSIDVVMYAQNLTDSQVLAGLAAAAGVKCTTVGEFLTALEQRTNSGKRPFTVLLDALDEATTPDTLCSQIVRPLIEHSCGRIRLILGTRPYLLDRLGISTLPSGAPTAVIDLDSPQFADREALLAYTMRNLLQSRSTSPYRRSDRALLRRVAEAVADAAGKSFLVARFAAYTLASADDAIADPSSTHWRAGLPRHAGQAMRDDLTQRLGPDAQRARDLLRPLAYAEGQGLPWEDIWAPLASAIAGKTYSDEDLLWLRHHAGSYVVEATESGRSAYRLYHQALAEHLREDTDPTPVHAAFVDVLTESVPYRGDATSDWSRAHPYTLSHLATHAVQAGRLDGILGTTEYLVHAVPHTLALHLDHATSAQARLTAAVYRTSFDRHATASTAERRSLLALNAARAGASTLLSQLNSHPHAGEWIPLWATGHDFTPALRHTLTSHDGPVGGVACTDLDGRPVAVTGGADTDGGRVQVWDLTTGRQIGRPLEHEAPVSVVACAVLDGLPVAVTGTRTGTGRTARMHVWDLATGRQIGEPLDVAGPVCALACTSLDGRGVAVLGVGAAGPTIDSRTGSQVYLVDLATVRLIGRIPEHEIPVGAVACAVLEDRGVAVIATGYSGRVSVWDLSASRQLAQVRPQLGSPATAAACVVVDGRPVAVTGTSAGKVYAWDVATGRRILERLDLHGPVHAVACAVVDGRPIAAIGIGVEHGHTASGTVHLWDLTSGQQIGEPLAGHSKPISALACTIHNDHLTVVSGGDDGTVRFWQPSQPSQPTSPPSAPHVPASSVTAMTCSTLDGRPVGLIGVDAPGTGAMLYVRDLATGEQIGTPIIGHSGPISALACTVLNERPIVVTGYGDNGQRFTTAKVCLWDLATGHRVGSPLTDRRGAVDAVACIVHNDHLIAVIGTDTGGGEVNVWDLTTGHQIGPRLFAAPHRYVGGVGAIACTNVDGHPVAVVGAAGYVTAHDLTHHEHDGYLRSDRRSAVNAVACTILDGYPTAIIGTTSGSVTVWDLFTGRQLSERVIELGAPVRALACTVLDDLPYAAISTDDGDLQIWDVRAWRVVQRILVPGLQDIDFAASGMLLAALGRDVAVFRRPPGQRHR